jgi:predicted acylesterase/phospholipase RssA
VSREEFENYKEDDGLAICIVGTVDFYTGKRYYLNLKEVTYGHFLKFVNASASLPVFTPGIFIDFPFKDFEGNSPTFDKTLLFDGGVRDHSPTHKILSSKVFNITETCTLFSRADKLSDILDPKSFKPKNILKILEKYVDISNVEVSKNDEYQEHQDCVNSNIIDHGIYFLPRIMDGIYDVSKPKLKKMYETAKTVTSDQWDKVAGHNIEHEIAEV